MGEKSQEIHPSETRKNFTHKQALDERSSQSSLGSSFNEECPETPSNIKGLILAFETKLLSDQQQNGSHNSCDDANKIKKYRSNGKQKLLTEMDKEKVTSIDAVIDKFQSYVKTTPKYEKPNLGCNDRMFYCCLIVAWNNKPVIEFKFPSNAEIPPKIEDLCFPESASGPLDFSNNAQCYTLVVTNDKGERTFGYCRRVIPEGSNKCIPLTYCILSKNRAPRFYKKLLEELETRHGIPDKLRKELIEQFYYNKFPHPGESVKIVLSNNYKPLNFEHTSQSENISSPIMNSDSFGRENSTELILTLHQDIRYEEADLRPLHTLRADILLKIFASLLLERKVVLISCMISKLSSCVDALQSILYPFSWPHTFIPILPECLWDVIESPTPVICGILSVSVVNSYNIEHGLVVDLDEGNIVCEEGDENSILSSCMKKAWQQGMALAKTVPPQDYVHSVYLSDAYIKVFIVALKHYKNHIYENKFEKESFIKHAKNKGIRRFLRWFSETTMFSSFIDNAINNPNCQEIFDKKIKIYGSDESDLILSKLLEWKK